jgi:hypothetical protein
MAESAARWRRVPAGGRRVTQAGENKTASAANREVARSVPTRVEVRDGRGSFRFWATPEEAQAAADGGAGRLVAGGRVLRIEHIDVWATRGEYDCSPKRKPVGLDAMRVRPAAPRSFEPLYREGRLIRANHIGDWRGVVQPHAVSDLKPWMKWAKRGRSK